MKVSKQPFIEHYHDLNGIKFVDNWQMGIHTLPFSSNISTSVYDKQSSLQSTVGQFVRQLLADGSQPIVNFEQSVLKAVENYLRIKHNMPDEQINQFLQIVKDVFDVNGNLNIADTSFYKYVPIIPDDSQFSDKDKRKYIDGLKKIADYLVSMFKEDIINLNEKDSNNLFLEIVSKAISSKVFESNNSQVAKKIYTIPQYIKDTFTNDLKWLLMQNEQIKIQYMHLLLHFYACYSVTQTLFLLSSNKVKQEDLSHPEPLYFILTTEIASQNHDAIKYGWPKKIQEPKILEKLYGKMQALDIINTVLGKNIGFYPDVINTLSETPIEDNKEILEEILKQYIIEKTALLNERKNEKERQINDFDTSFSSYEEFLNKLEKYCIELQSKDYKRFKKKITDIMHIHFLSSRRGNDVLVLDHEMLSFLIILTTKGRKVKLEDMYKNFNTYGIYFNRGTRFAIEEYLLKMNLLDRKSDSGEVQYVRTIL